MTGTKTTTAKLGMEPLEARENMSSNMLGAFGDGIYLTGALTGATVVTHTPLHPGAVAQQVAVANDRAVLADLGKNGLWLYQNGTREQLTTADAVAIDISSNGLVAASFKEYGTQLWQKGAGWKQADPRTAEDVEVYRANVNGTSRVGVLSDMGNAGVFESVMGPRGLVSRQQVITGNPEQVVATEDGRAFLDYGAHGLYGWQPNSSAGTFVPVDDRNAVSLDVSSTAVVATFAGEPGLHLRNGANPLGAGFVQVAEQTPNRVKVTNFGEVIADFGNGKDAGVWLMNPQFTDDARRWKLLYSTSPIAYDAV